MGHRIGIIGTAITLFLLLLTACTLTKLTGIYKDKSYTGGYLKSVLVVGVSDNVKNRRLFEDTFTEQFKRVGIEAISSAVIIPKDKKLDTDTIKKSAESQGFETVLVTHLVGVEEKTTYVPPRYDYLPSRYHHLGPYYHSVDRYVHTPGYYIKRKHVRLESNLYETKTEKLIWSALSETIDPKSVNALIESLCQKVMKSLKTNNLIISE